MIKLLVVDDSALMRKLLSGIFTAEGDFEVRLARNGVEALQLLPDFRPDVVTLDIHMPEMDGLACLDRIMLDHPTPVVMISSLTASGAEETLMAMNLGAVDFIAKPGGAVSLEIDTLAPGIVAKVRMAAKARLPSTMRLADRVRARHAHEGLRPVRPLPRTIRQAAPVARSFDIPEGAWPVVLVGTSTGGPPALEAVLGGLPSDFPCPVIVAQHMPSSFTGPLARRLDGLCRLDVVEVVQPMPLHPGTVYIGRGDADIVIRVRAEGLAVTPVPSQAGYLWHPSVERLVSSALEIMEPSRLIGVLMTGMGRDGADAMTRLREGGGHTIAESEETAVVWGMPGELVKGGGAEFVHPVHDIANRLVRLVGI